MTNAIGVTLIIIRKRMEEIDNEIDQAEKKLESLRLERCELAERQAELYEGIDSVKKDGSVNFIGSEVEN